MPQFDVAVIKDLEDFVLIVKPYCKECAIRKLDVIVTFEVDGNEARKLVTDKMRCVRVSCDCEDRDE